MPHYRKRHIEPVLKKLLGMSPIVGILGHRQVGKTTTLEKLAKHYYTMDDSRELLSAQNNPKQYLAERADHKAALDECQLAPELFPALKEWVRTHPRPGQFLLSGSVRFTSRKVIQESLTGRIVNLELLPLLISELTNAPLPNFWRRHILSDSFPRETLVLKSEKLKTKTLEQYLISGGLPGLCFIRDQRFLERKLDTQVETMLDRDLRKIVPTHITYPELRRLVQILADRQGENFPWTEMSRESGISIPTLKKLLFGLESVFLIRTVAVEGNRTASVYYFEDLGELNFLRTEPLGIREKVIHTLMVHIRGEMSYGSSVPFRIFQYRTRAGVCVPLVLQVKDQFMAVIALEAETPSRSEMAAADSFLKRYNRSKVVMIHRGGNLARLDSRKMVMPLQMTV